MSAKTSEILCVIETTSGIGVILRRASTALTDAYSDPVSVLLLVPQCGEC